MARYLILAAVLIANAFADDGYAAPSAGYAAPSGGYSAPSGGYAAPNDGYGAPSDGYGAPTAPADGYGAPADNYGVQAYNEPTGYATSVSSNDIFSLEKFIYLIPFFLAVLAAIIIAQVVSPFIATVIGLEINAAAGLLSGLVGTLGGVAGTTGTANLGAIPLDLLNAVLTPFNLAICTISPLALAGSGTTGRGFLDPELVQSVGSMLYSAYENYTSAE